MRNDETDALFEAKVIELIERAEQYKSGYSAFFTPKEQIIAKGILTRRKGDCVCFFFGGYDGSERNRLFALPEYMGDLEKYDFSNITENYGETVFDAVSAVKISGSGYRKLTHRDYLGSLLGLGIERGVIGDIALLDDFSAVVFCDRRIAEFILLELKKVASDTVKTARFEVSSDFSNTPEFQLLSDTVASARFDCVVSALTGLSREKAQSVIRIGDAELNYFKEDRADRTVDEGSVISVRGYGKFVVVGLSEHTKKGRLRLQANKYI
jgi:RNA-binding protein YlmH